MGRSRDLQRVTTIKDIAHEAGVSNATVSRALSGGKAGMSEQTREKILQIAKRLDYFPNLQARALARQRPNIICIIIPQPSEFAFSNPYYAEILKGIGEKSRECGQIHIFSFAGEESYARMVQYGLSAGIIILGNRINDPRIQDAWRLRVPLVLIPGDPQHPRIPNVDIDNADGAFQAVDHLAQLGHLRIAFLNGPANSKYSSDRFEGYLKALKKNHLPFDQDLVWELDFSQESAYAGAKKLLELPQPPTSFLVVSDYTALGALRATKEMGYHVPSDISIVGFGDVPFTSIIDPPLTTVREPFQKMGREATAMLVKLIQGKSRIQKHRILPVELVIRKSTAPPPKSKFCDEDMRQDQKFSPQICETEEGKG